MSSNTKRQDLLSKLTPTVKISIMIVVSLLILVGITIAWIRADNQLSAKRELASERLKSATIADTAQDVVEHESIPNDDIDLIKDSISSRLSSCINQSLSLEQEDIRGIVNSCYLNYLPNLGELYAIRHIDEVTITNLDIVEPETALISAEIVGVNTKELLGSISCYWVDSLNQCKVIQTTLTRFAQERASQSTIDTIRQLGESGY